MTQHTSTQEFDSTTQAGVKFVLRKWSVKRRRQYNEKMAPLLQKERLIQLEEADYWAALEEAKKIACTEVCSCKKHEHVGKRDEPCEQPNCECKHGRLTGQEYVDHAERIEQINGIINNEMVPERLRWAVESISGIETDGKPVDVEVLIELGPDDLAQEIHRKIEEMLFPTPDEVKNSSSPIIGTLPGDGATTSGSVADANGTASTNVVIAASTFLAK